MISAEAPILFAKAVNIFSTETYKLQWIHARTQTRTLRARTLLCNFAKSDMFDFLIDIVPLDKEVIDYGPGSHDESNPASRTTAGPRRNL